jgi:hypothetical protein
MLKWIVVALLLAHGGAHSIGVAGSLFGKDLEGISGATTIEVGRFERAFAALWLVALLAFLAAGLALAIGHGWWRPIALSAAIISSIAVAVWWEDAWRGAPLNALVIGAVVASPWLSGLTPD